MKKTIIILTISILAALSNFWHGKGPQNKLQDYYNAVKDSGQHNGNIIAAENGKVIAQLCSGILDAKQTPSEPGSGFNLASISKVITSTAVLQLRDKGKFALDDELALYLTDFPFKDVTIRSLLSHTSGLPDLELFEELIGRFPDSVVTNSNVIPELCKWKKGLYFKPGEDYRYCNTEYNLLALLVEKVSGLTFGDYLKKNIFRQANMGDTYVNTFPHFPGNDSSIATPLSKPHPGYDSTYVAADAIARYRYLNYNLEGLVGQGNIISTTEDLLRFDTAFFSGKLLKKSSVEEALTPITFNNGQTYYAPRMDTLDGQGKMNYGLGWEIFELTSYGKAVGHGGYKIGLGTFYLHLINKSQTIIGFDNKAGSELGRFLSSSLAILNNKEPLPLRTSKSLVTLYGTALVAKGPDYAAAIFNAHKSDTSKFYFSEWEMNELGYDLFYMSAFEGHKILGLETFKLATLLFPDSFNTYDSYGQLLMESGKIEEAILMYKKSIELDPANEDGKRMLGKLLKNINSG